MLAAYRAGWFPMYDESKDVVEWVQPRRRALVPLGAEEFVISRSLRQRVRSGKFEIRSDTAFARVIRECAEPGPGREGTWLHPDIIHAFEVLHRAGHVHSVEAWLPSAGGAQLVGGLYGIALGGAFCGESMFSRPLLGGTDASKVCLVHLVSHLRRRGFRLLDSQIENPHMARFGVRTMPAKAYTKLLAECAKVETGWGTFDGSRARVELMGSGGS